MTFCGILLPDTVGLSMTGIPIHLTLRYGDVLLDSVATQVCSKAIPLGYSLARLKRK